MENKPITERKGELNGKRDAKKMIKDENEENLDVNFATYK